MYVVELQDGCWLADWPGDPGRTIVFENAKVFKTFLSAEKALNKARLCRPLKDSCILQARYSQEVARFENISDLRLYLKSRNIEDYEVKAIIELGKL